MCFQRLVKAENRRLVYCFGLGILDCCPLFRQLSISDQRPEVCPFDTLAKLSVLARRGDISNQTLPVAGIQPLRSFNC